MTYADLGNIMIATAGLPACEQAYQSTDPAMIGRVALGWGDINTDGTTN